MPSPTQKLLELGIQFPPLSNPAGNYVHVTRSEQLLFLAGKGFGSYHGKVGRDVSVEEAYQYARSTGLMLLSVIKQELGSIDRVSKILKVSGFINALPEFSEHPKVMNGCSDLLLEVFGECGKHARTSIGVGSTPDQIPLEIEMIIEVKEL
jgi:enamine deaminase RidA (YjgF/YER057c/UK114 family)